MPTHKVLVLILVLYVILIFIPILGFLYFRDSLPFNLVGNNMTAVRESSESTMATADIFGRLANPMPLKSTFFDVTNLRNGKFGGINTEDKTITISVSVDEKGTLSKNVFTFNNDTLVLCTVGKIKDSLGNEINSSEVFVGMDQMSDASYEEFFKYFKGIPISERLNELKDYKAGDAIHYETNGNTNEKPLLYWVKIFKEDCGKFSIGLYD